MKKTFPKRRPTDTRAGAIALLAAIICAAAAGAAVFPAFTALTSTPLMSEILSCPINRLSGLRCPLCGGTRCVRALLRLDIGSAFYYNPMVTIAAFAAVYAVARLALSCLRREYKPWRPGVSQRGIMWFAAIYVTFMIVRNLPFYRALLY